MKRIFAVLTVVALCTLTGCGGADNSGPRAGAEAFYQSVTQGQFATACDRLFAQTRQTFEEDEAAACTDALPSLNLSSARVEEVQSYGNKAMVKLDGDTVFLVQQRNVWLVVAAGCEAHFGKPYDCDLEAG